MRRSSLVPASIPPDASRIRPKPISLSGRITIGEGPKGFPEPRAERVAMLDDEFEDEPTRPRASITPSAARRAFAVGLLLTLGGLLIYLALSQAAATVFATVFLLGTGLGSLALAEALRRATAVHLHLTDTALMDSTGVCLARLDEIERVDRGAFAFKPSNGFILHLASPGDRHWAPGLWWRLGRRIGVGGVTSAAETKVVAEAISFTLAQRDAPE